MYSTNILAPSKSFINEIGLTRYIELTSEDSGKMGTKNFHLDDIKNKYLVGDCENVLKKVKDNAFDLIVTSPPYADSRIRTYGGISPDEYVDWFLPKTKEFLRTLKPTGTFILNIKERVVDGERHPYVLNLIQKMRKQGWHWTEEYIWVKKNSYPGKWPNRFRDAWERCIQFNKTKNFKMYQDEVMIPIGDWAKGRLKNLSETDKKRDDSEVNSGFGKNISNWVGRNKVYPNNVLVLPTECANRNHSAVYPVALPSWFIRLFTKKGDFVLDPFAGSGTTGVASAQLKRDFLLIDILGDYNAVAERRIKNEGYQNQ